MTIRLVIADDHPIVRSGIRGELARYLEFEIVGEAANGDEALRLAYELQPDVLILDVNMPGLKAIEVLTQIKRELRTCRVAVLTAFGDTPTVLGMLKAGADSYLLKDEDPNLISEAIRATAEGKIWLSQGLSEQLLTLMDGLKKRTGALTRREREVLQMLTQGKTNKEIAAILKTTERTVEFHVGNLIEKLGVKNRWEAADWARQHGLASDR